MKTQTLAFIFEKETKNTYRYTEKERDLPPAVGTLYLQKWALEHNPPEILEVTIKEAFGTVDLT